MRYQLEKMISKLMRIYNQSIFLKLIKISIIFTIAFTVSGCESAPYYGTQNIPETVAYVEVRGPLPPIDVLFLTRYQYSKLQTGRFGRINLNRNKELPDILKQEYIYKIGKEVIMFSKRERIVLIFCDGYEIATSVVPVNNSKLHLDCNTGVQVEK